MMSVTDLAELDIMRNMPNEVLNVIEICDYIENIYMAYDDAWGTSSDMPEIVLIVGGFSMIISEAMDMPNDKYRITEVTFENDAFWRTCKITAEYADIEVTE